MPSLKLRANLTAARQELRDPTIPPTFLLPGANAEGTKETFEFFRRAEQGAKE